MLPRNATRNSVAEKAHGFPGVGLFFGNQVELLQLADCVEADTCRRLFASELRREIVSRFRSAPSAPGYHRLLLPFGIQATIFPIDKIVGNTAATFIITSIDPTATSVSDWHVLRCLGRKPKKYATHLVKQLKSWTHPRADEIEGMLNEIAVSIRSDADAHSDESITKTLVSYKDFVSSFAHEALTPIQEIRTSLELTAKSKGINESSRDRLSRGLSSLDSLRVSLEGMRLLFRENEKAPLLNQFRDYDVRGMVTRWLNLYERQFSDKNIGVIIEPQDAAFQLRCVPEYMEVLIKNLISNGVKYSFDATEYEEPGKFVVRFDSRLKTLSFINFGVPIRDEEIQSGELFSRGHRSPGADDRGRVGKGIGLHLVKRVCDLHRAVCEVSSQIKNPGGHQLFARNEFKVCFPRK